MRNRKLTGLVFLTSCILFTMHQYLQWVALVPWPFIDNYLDPALMMPIVLHLIRWERRLVLNNRTLHLPAVQCTCYFLLIAFTAEVIFPLFSNKFTGDWRDVISYAVGTVVYIVAQKFSGLR